MGEVWPLSITVSTTGFHPVNAGSTPAEVTKTENGQSTRVPSGRFATTPAEVTKTENGQSTRVPSGRFATTPAEVTSDIFTMWFSGGPVAQLVRARAF